MNIDYEILFPLALQATYPLKTDQEIVAKKLEVYGSQSFHQERFRVWLGILYLSNNALGQLDSLIELACCDYRDLLCAAEYPRSSRQWDLPQKDPEKYKALQLQERQEYLAWIEKFQHTK